MKCQRCGGNYVATFIWEKIKYTNRKEEVVDSVSCDTCWNVMIIPHMTKNEWLQLLREDSNIKG